MKTEKRKKDHSSLLITLLICAIVFIRVFVQSNKESNGVLWADDQTRMKQEASYISIPGFSEIHFIADKTEQEFSFHNPAKNHCIMDIELRLENGEIIFSEDNIHPGYGIKNVQLNKELPSGDYRNCKLTIRCYASDGVFYNGANLTVDLFVR